MADIPATIHDVPTPSLLVDIDKLKRNCEKMKTRCDTLGVKLRPHMKTHKTIEAGEIMTNGTRRCIVVSTVEEVRFFAEAGFEDILYGIIITEEKAKRVKKYANQLVEFHVLFDSIDGIEALRSIQLNDGKKWSVFLKVDTGCNRAGVLWDSEEAVALTKEATNSSNIHFQGLYAHCGHSYDIKADVSMSTLNEESGKRLTYLRDRLREKGIECNTIGTGSTPFCSRPGDTVDSVLTEFHPGNYVFYDYMQCVVGSCTMDEIAVKVATRVTGHRPELGNLLVDCGFLGLSHDGMGNNMDLEATEFCCFQDHPELRMADMCQEVGKVKSKTGNLDFKEHPIGSMLFIYPWHSCATAANHPVYYIHSGERIVDVWRPTRGW